MLMTSTYISARLRALDRIDFDSRDFQRLFRLAPARANSVLRRMVSRGLLRRLRRGRYVVSGPGDARVISNPLFLGTRAVAPSYVSFLSALHLRGWTEQVPREVTLATTRRSTVVWFDAFRFRAVQVAPRRFFGYEEMRQDGLRFPVADPEKAIVDSLWWPQAVGAFDRVEDAFRNALPELRLSRLARYARAMGSRVLQLRLGFLCEEAGCPLPGFPLRPPAYYARLDSAGPRQGRYYRRWGLVDNRPVVP